MTAPADHELNALGQAIGPLVPGWHAVPRPTGRTLAGTRVHVERLDPARHAADLWVAAQADTSGGTWTYMPYGPFADAAEHQAWLQRVAATEDPLLYAIVDPMRGAVGQAALMRIDPANGVIEIGHIWMGPTLARSTRATEALYLLMREAFGLGYRRLEWKCNALNVASRRAATRLGFTFEGIFRQAVIVKGRNRDTAWFALLDHEWPAAQAAFEQWLAPGNFDALDHQQRKLTTLRDAAGGPRP